MATPEHGTAEITIEPVRRLTATDLDIDGAQAIAEHGSNRADDAPLPADHPHLLAVTRLLKRFGGVIFTGPPGTSKSYYASKIGSIIAEEDEKRILYVQFHPAYQYEDFMEGFVPRPDGTGFDLKAKPFHQLCIDAGKDSEHLYVLVIDELSRGDPGRVFGEALTYLERSKRGLAVTLASGSELVVPDNVVILATMNPMDRGVDEVDAAFERRFAKIAMPPDVSVLTLFLEQNGLPQPLRSRVIQFFQMVNGKARDTPQAAVGQAYFRDAVDEQSLRDIWEYQLRFIFEKAYRLNLPTLAENTGQWDKIFVPLDPLSDEALELDAENEYDETENQDEEPDFDDIGD
jgi:5-methylcytosine-specific restriction protein B